jgi:hypothetical protein
MRLLHSKKHRSQSQDVEAKSSKEISVIKTDPPAVRNYF